MERWTRAMIRFRWVVVATWAVVFVVSVMAMSMLSDLLTNRFTLPGSDSHRAEQVLEDHFGQNTTGSFTLVVRGAAGSAGQLRPAVEQAATRAAAVLPTGHFVSAQAASDSLVDALIVSNLEPADAKGHTDEMREAAGEIPGAEIFLTGQAAIEHDLDPVFARDLQVGELYIAIPIALAILVFVFGTLAFILPLIFAAAAIPTTLAIIWIFANFMELSTYLQNLVMLIGLGIAIDYSLLVVYRYREELHGGRTKEDAIVETMKTAGRAVVFSGTAVAIGLTLMLAMPVPFIRGFGIGGLFIPVVSVACALTLLPALLYIMAARLDRVRLLPRSLTDRREAEENAWVRLARMIMRHPAAVAAATTALLVALALPVLSLQLGPGSNQGIPRDLESVRGLDIISEELGEGALAPTVVVVDSHQPGGIDDPRVVQALGRLLDGINADAEVAADVTVDDTKIATALGVPQGSPDTGGEVTEADTAPANGQSADRTRQYLQLQVTGHSEYGVPASLDFAKRLRENIVPTAAFPAGADVYAGGGPPSGVDFLDLTYGTFPWVVLGVLVLTYVLLLRAFRSLLLPLKAIVLNLLSISAAYGLLVIFFDWGGADAIGLISFDQIEAWIPVFIFAMVFGLSMDYEVFLVSRMREEWDAGRDNESAVAFGLAKTGRIVTAAGLVMFAAFMGFVAGSIVGLQQFGFGLAAAIILDVTIVRALLVPSAMKLFGRWNWWLPPNVARVFRVEPSPLAHPALPAQPQAPAAPTPPAQPEAPAQPTPDATGPTHAPASSPPG